MRNFQRISQGLDVLPIVNSVLRQPNLWNTEKLRTFHMGTPHMDVEDILLRFNDLNEMNKAMAAGAPLEEYAAKIIDEHESIFYPAWYAIPECHAIVFDLMRYLKSIRLGRVMITRLAPGKKILPHADGGSHAEYYDRFHLTLQNNPGSLFRAGNETVTMKPGELWWFDNKQEHEVINNSNDDRLTMIIDLKL